MQLLQLFTAGGVAILAFPIVDINLCIWVCEVVGAVLTYQVHAAVMPTLPQTGPMQGVPGGRPPAGYQPLPGGPSGFPGPAAGSTVRQGPPPQQGFKVFGGQGNRLGG